MLRSSAAVLLVATSTACIQTRPYPPRFSEYYEDPNGLLIQGLIGISELTPDLTLDPELGILPEGGDLTGPVIGGAIQRRYVGEGLELGLEGGFTFSWDRSRTDFVSGGSILEANEDVLLADLFGGALLNFQGETLRAYAAAGPLLQYGEVELETIDGFGSTVLEEDGSFGFGVYARVGVELALTPSKFLGIGVRWVDSELDLGGNLGDLDIEAFQAFVTVTDYGWVRPYF